ncbi:MAG: type VI secretion system-associated FHA domain protein [Deltaproteobacteria bacterium]
MAEANELIVRVTVMAPLQSDRPASAVGGALTREYRFSRLPISIGRAQDNDLEIPSPFVSGSHARIEELGGRLWVRDLGSRNGVHVLLGAESVRIAPQSAYPVSSDGFELQLGSETRLQVERAGPPALEPARPEQQAAPPARIAVTSLPKSPGLGDGLPPLPDLGRPLRSLPPLDVPLGASALDARALSLPVISPRDRGAEQPRPVRGFEPVRPDPGQHAGSSARQHAAGLKTGNFELRPEVLALQGLRELTTSLSPGRTLDTQGDVARLVTRLHDVLEVVCRSYLSLRDGHAKFVASFHLHSSAEHDPARSALDSARDASAVAALLLDFREPAPDASPALERALKELGLHQVALLDGVMQGIRALLEELSPANIQQEVERGAPRLGRPARALWDEYCARYARFAQEGEAFSRVFGEEFASAYRRYQHSRRSR